ncbi:MAG TPA: RodZ domain-containing protein [Oxalicibacterium sp.]|jgi:cytoskeleton protein RodZ|nr:RodZ domain-containing protein [Oxalicibacterium sp.]
MNEDTPVNASTDIAPADPVQAAEPLETARPLPSAGTQLQTLREARGWTVEQVANQLNLAPRQIDALERDHYAALPGMVIVRGFIRTYAKLLQTDAAPILAAIKDDGAATDILPPPRSPISASFSETQLLSGKAKRRGFPLKTVLVLIVVLGIAAVLVFEGQRLGWYKHGNTGNASSTKVVVPLAINHAPAKAAAEATPVAKPATAPVSAVGANEHATAAPPVAAESKPAAEAPKTSAVAGKNVLAIRVHQDSWVEIRRADDSILFSSLLKAGAAESFDLNGPVSMVVGNAAGVDVSLRGVPVDLKGNPSNVARLNLK